MKKLGTLDESSFQKWLFSFWTIAFFVAAIIMPDRNTMITGLVNIINEPCKLSINYFAVGGYSATFFNVGLCSLAFLVMMFALKVKCGKVTVLGFMLIPAFSFWGINILNMWFSLVGVILYCVIKKEKLSSQFNALLFTTGATPLISELLLRYPNKEIVGLSGSGILLALVVGIFIGITVPAGLSHSPVVHKGFDLYSAALPVTMMVIFLNATLYKSMGISTPAGPDSSTHQVASWMITNGFYLVMFVLCIVLALAMGVSLSGYWKVLTGPKPETTLADKYGNPMLLFNMGCYGLFILAYYNIVGATFNSITCGIVLNMLACCNDGSHPGNVWPIMLGYAAASWLCNFFSGIVGGSFSGALSAQGIVVAVCFASGMSPITSKYGVVCGFLVAIAHYLLVTSVPAMHGGFCLYNGGFTAALICLIFVPQIERFVKAKY